MALASGPRTAVPATAESLLERARAVAAAVTDPELPMLTLADLGVLREVYLGDDGGLVVALTPTYSGCPAMAAMRDDVVRTLRQAGFDRITILVSLSPAWTSDWITERGRRALAEHGISPPGRAPHGPVPLSLSPSRRVVHCPHCGSQDASLTSEFGATACKALYRCRTCDEPFEHVKEI